MHGTTIVGVLRNGAVALAGDGQVTAGDIIVKQGARKVRTLHDGNVVAGFAGAVADALTLYGKFESQLKACNGDLRRAAVELAREWRSDRYLRRLEAQLIVADVTTILVISGDGDVIEPDDGVAAIGSGAPYATAAAKALLHNTEMDARAIVEATMDITADICIFTNRSVTVAVAEKDRTTENGEESGNEMQPAESTLPNASSTAKTGRKRTRQAGD